MKNTTIIAGFGLLLTACGQPGPLYLPKEPMPVETDSEAKAETKSDAKSGSATESKAESESKIESKPTEQSGQTDESSKTNTPSATEDVTKPEATLSEPIISDKPPTNP